MEPARRSAAAGGCGLRWRALGAPRQVRRRDPLFEPCGLRQAWRHDQGIEQRRTARPHLGGHQTHSARQGRSEEHTSELQSLMRISYAVFCLKKKKKNSTNVIKTNGSQER